MTGACMICGAAAASFRLGWPGWRADQPAKLRGRSLRLCRLDGECAAQAIARASTAAGRPWPFTHHDAALAPRVAEILGAGPTGGTPPPPPAPPPPPPPQPPLI